MQINYSWNPSTASAPPQFKAALAAAANYLDTQIIDPITVNIRVGWGEHWA